MKKKIFAILLSITTVFTLAACGPSGGTVATVNGKSITEGDLNCYYGYLSKYYEQMYSQFGMQFSVTDDMETSMKNQSIDGLVSMEELHQACEEKECTPSKKEITEYVYEQIGVKEKEEYKTALKDIMDYYGFSEKFAIKMISQGLYAEKLGDALVEEDGYKVSDEEAEKIYSEDPALYNNRTVSHILIKPVLKDGEEAEQAEDGSYVYTDEQWAAAEKKANDLIKQLDEGADFEKLAKENSDDTSASDGGALGDSFTEEGSPYVSEFTEGSFALTKVGEYSKKPVKSAFGYHIILCTGLQDKNTEFDELLKTIKEEKVAEKSGELLNDFMNEYHENADIDVSYDGYASAEDELSSESGSEYSSEE